MWRRASFLIAGALCAACASANTHRPVRTSSHDVITAAEIVAARVTDVYQAVVQLRPEFLRRRPIISTSLTYTTPQVMVYLDDLPFGNAESMRHIPLDRVRRIRYLKPSEADIRFPGSHPAGAIVVITRR